MLFYGKMCWIPIREASKSSLYCSPTARVKCFHKAGSEQKHPLLCNPGKGLCQAGAGEGSSQNKHMHTLILIAVKWRIFIIDPVT